jgi:signal transduction histidine kinase/ligand-binding sensor domain-containing protein
MQQSSAVSLWGQGFRPAAGLLPGSVDHIMIFSENPMTLRGVRLAVLLLAALVSGIAHRLPIQHFGTAQGLARDSVVCMVAGPSGVLWLCTPEGLVRFDGYRFRVFGTDDGLPSRNILDFVPSKKGGFWVVTDRGVCRISPGAKIGDRCPLLDVDRPEGDFVSHALIESRDGGAWVATTRRLYHLSTDGRRLEFSGFEPSTLHSIQTLAEGWDGGLLISTNFAVFDWKPGSQARNLSVSVGALGLRRLLRASEGEFWGVAGHNVYSITRDGVRRSRIEGPEMKDLVQLNSLMRRSDGTIWAAAIGGILQLQVRDGRASILKRYSESDGLPTREVDWLTEDAHGDLWGTTDGAGIFRIEDHGFVSYSEKDGLGAARIAAIFEDRQGRICVQAGWNDPPGILLQNGDHFETVLIPHPHSLTYFGWGWHQTVVTARDGEWWIPTAHGLLRFPKLRHTEDLAHTNFSAFYSGDSELGDVELFRAFEDSNRDIWLVCLAPKRRLIRWERSTGRFRDFTAADGWPTDRVVTVFRQDSSGTLWLGSPEGVARYRHGRFELLPMPFDQKPFVRDLLFDHAGRLWVAAYHVGVFRSDNPGDPTPAFRAYTPREGLSSSAIVSVLEDNAGFIYAGGARGVDRIDPRVPIDSRQVRHFTVADGLPESEQSTAFHDSKDHLWFGTLHGLAELDPSKLAKNAPPQVYFMRVRIRGEDVPIEWEGAKTVSLNLAADRNQIEIEYAGIDLEAPESLRYQYRMEDLGGWSEPTDQLRVNYASLPAGRHRFEVRAMDADGQLSPQTAGLDFFVQAPLWRRWWFLSLLLLFASAAIAAVHQYRVRHLLAMQRLRNRIAADLHDDIGSSLTQISILSEVGNRATTSSVLSEIGGIARDMVAEMSEIVWAMAPRSDRFDDLIHRLRRFADDVLGGAEIELRFDTHGLSPGVKIPLDARRPLYLIFKEAVNNVVRHSGASTATIVLEADDDVLKLTVEDDGCGFDVALPSNGEGLASMARRMKQIGGTAEWNSEPGRGTRFTAALPLASSGNLHRLVGLLRRPRR